MTISCAGKMCCNSFSRNCLYAAKTGSVDCAIVGGSSWGSCCHQTRNWQTEHRKSPRRLCVAGWSQSANFVSMGLLVNGMQTMNVWGISQWQMCCHTTLSSSLTLPGFVSGVQERKWINIEYQCL
eukprot:4131938-Amphidinium_carterae.1